MLVVAAVAGRLGTALPRRLLRPILFGSLRFVADRTGLQRAFANRFAFRRFAAFDLLNLVQRDRSRCEQANSEPPVGGSNSTLRRRHAVLIGVGLLLVGSAGLIYSQKPDIGIGRSESQLTYRSQKDLIKPKIDFSLLGRSIQYPKPLPIFDTSMFGSDWAGVIYTEKDLKTTPVWIWGDVEVEQVNTARVLGGRIIFVPYAPVEDRRHATLRLGDEEIPIRLPFNADKVPQPPETIEVQAGPYMIVATPGERPFRRMDLPYRLSVKGPQEHVIAIGEIAWDGWLGDHSRVFTNEWATRFDPKHYTGTVTSPDGAITTVKAKLYVVQRIEVPVEVTEGQNYETTLWTLDKRQLMTSDEFKFLEQGYIGLIYKGNLYYNAMQTGEGLVAHEPASTATLLKPVAAYPFELRIDNTGP